MDDDNVPLNPKAVANKKLTSWKKEPTLEEIKLDVSNSRPFQSTHITRVNNWLDQLNLTGQAKMPKTKNRSQIQPKLIRKQAEWRYGALSEPFLSADSLFSLSPRSWEDRNATQQNEIVLNWQFDEILGKVNFIDQMVRTVVDEGTVCIEVGWERETKIEKVEVPVWGYFEIETEEQMAQIDEATALYTQNNAEFVKLPEEIQESVRYSIEVGKPLLAQQMGMEKVDKEIVLRNEPTLEIADIRNLVIDATCGGDRNKAMFTAYSSEVTRGSLERDKRYVNLDKVHFSNASPLAQPDHVTQGVADVNFKDRARQKVVLERYWGYYDIEGEGHLTPIHVAWIGDTIVRMEVNPFPDGKDPFVLGALMPIKKSFYGEPDAELLEDNQKIIGAVTRGMIDLMARSANAQRGMAKNLLDITNKRRFDSGEDYEFNPNMHPSNSIVEHKFPEIPQSAGFMLQMQNNEAESLTGVKMFSSNGMNSSSLGEVAAGIRGILDAASKRENGILRRLASCMAEVGKKIASMNQEFMSEEQVIRVTNEEFVTIRRDELKGNFDMKVAITTAEENEAKATRLEFLLQTMGNTGDLGITKILLSEIARLRRMPDLSHMIKNFQPEPDPVEQAMRELDMREREANIMLLEAKAMETKAQAELNVAKAREAIASAEMKDLDFVEQESGTKQARSLQMAERQAEANQDLTVTKAILGQRNGVNADGKVDTSPTRENISDAVGFNSATRS